jgi:hypothetical protein
MEPFDPWLVDLANIPVNPEKRFFFPNSSDGPDAARTASLLGFGSGGTGGIGSTGDKFLTTAFLRSLGEVGDDGPERVRSGLDAAG